MATWLTDHSTCLTYISVLKKRDGSLIMMVSYKYVLLIEESYHWHFLEASAPGAPVTVSSTTVPVPEAGDETRHFPWRQNGWRWRVVLLSSLHQAALKKKSKSTPRLKVLQMAMTWRLWLFCGFEIWLSQVFGFCVCQKWEQKLVHVGCGLSRLFMCRNMKRLKGT